MFKWLKMYLFFVILLIGLVFLLLLWTKFFLFFFERKILHCYECGFETKDFSRFSFSLKFFIFLILFVIFDVELCLLMSLPFQYQSKFFFNRLEIIFLVFMLFFGILEEYRRGTLSW